MRSILFSFLSILVIAAAAYGQRDLGVRPTETGGPLSYEQAAYDVYYYGIDVKVDPKERSIIGEVLMTGRIVHPTNVIVVDLDTPFQIESIENWMTPAKWERRGGKIWIKLPQTLQAGEMFAITTKYSGKPRVAPRPPWIGGFMWEKTPSGADWISVALQNDGADLYFPIKDHPSDKADTADMFITVPDPLVVAGPGILERVDKNTDGTTTFKWSVKNPIPNYSLVFNAAPYKVIKDSVKSITGENIPIEFYILPENFEKGPRLIEETKKYNAFLEKYLGPYPWRSQKLGIAETPHLGMEHSTMIAYGNKFKYNEDGIDGLMLHEYGHEWWANLVTASDWRDFWIHEGFQSFMDTLYLEHIGKKDAYFAGMRNRAARTRNMQPVAPREMKFAYEVYLQAPDFIASDGDIYGKGAVVLHTLRYLIGDEAFFRALRRMAYPDKEMESRTDGSQTRLVNTDDFLTIAEEESKMELGWFFEVYLRQPKLPKLVLELVPGTLSLSWETPNNLPFPMPLDVVINGKTERIEMKDGKARVSYTGDVPTVDPVGWVLKAR
ncbi:MAG: M1 family metallopeptidase [Acidobacteriota bacterium]|nr:MAG: M1 family metallopeptidase [Acidobacteriota bacterium]